MEKTMNDLERSALAMVRIDLITPPDSRDHHRTECAPANIKGNLSCPQTLGHVRGRTKIIS